MQNYFTAIEQAAICMETRMVRTAAREREYAQDNKLLCFLASGILVPTTVPLDVQSYGRCSKMLSAYIQLRSAERF